LEIDICPWQHRERLGLTLSQEGKPQTHTGKVHDVQRISHFSQQDFSSFFFNTAFSTC